MCNSAFAKVFLAQGKCVSDHTCCCWCTACAAAAAATAAVVDLITAAAAATDCGWPTGPPPPGAKPGKGTSGVWNRPGMKKKHASLWNRGIDEQNTSHHNEHKYPIYDE